MLATTVLTATLLVVPATSGAATGTTSIALSGPAASSLKAQKVTLVAGAPAKATAKRLSLPVAGGSLSSRSTTVAHGGSLRLKAGKRSVQLTDFRVALGKAPRVTARLGGSTVSFATLTLAKGKGKAAKIDVAAKTVTLTGATASLPAKTARSLAKKLRLRKLSGGRLGTLTITANLTAAKPSAPVPPPAAQVPVPAAPIHVVPPPVVVDPPVVPPVVTPAGPTCPAAPVGTLAQTGWNIRKSFVDYLYTAWGGPGPTTTAGVFASAGAVQADPSSRYGWCFGVTGATKAGDGTIKVQHKGTIAFVLTAHYLDIKISDPRIEIAPGGLTGRLYADGQGSGTREEGQSGNAAPDPFTNQHLFDLTFNGAPTTDGTTVVYHVTSSKVANDRAAELLSNPVGEVYGNLDVTVPPTSTEGP